MADNVAITAGAGTNIATDDVGGVHYQKIKLVYGADDVANLVQDTLPIPTKHQAHASGGCSMLRLVSAASTNATSVKGSAGQVYGVWIGNSNTSFRYLKLYNKASAPTVGTDTPVATLPLPGSGGGVLQLPPGAEFTVGIALALTTGAPDSDVGGVAANEIVLTLFYK